MQLCAAKRSAATLSGRDAFADSQDGWPEHGCWSAGWRVVGVRREPWARVSSGLAVAAWNDDGGGSATWVTGLRLPSRRANSLAESAEGQRPRRLAYQIVPPPHASAPSSEEGGAVAVAALAAARPRHPPRAPAGDASQRRPEAPADPCDHGEEAEDADHAGERAG